MSRRAARFWALTAAETAAALSLAIVLGPPGLVGTLPLSASLASGALVGFLLVTVLGRRLPPVVRVSPGRRRLVAAKALVLAWGSACEEVIWRWFAIGALTAPLGLAGAVATTTVAFALAHARRRRRSFAIHLATGATFGSLFAATGSLVAAALAHATYNVTVLLALESRRGRSSSVAPSSA